MAYSGIFNYPLRASEVQNILRHSYSIDKVESALHELKTAGCCFEFDGHFSLSENVAEELKTRQEQHRNAAVFYSKLPPYARVISGFPFVRSVAISGSLSKGVIHNKGDVDYFIITAHNRLWLARMLLIIYKKTVLLNSRKYFCVNYFISEKSLEIPDKNIFTATEINTLLPIYNRTVFQKFMHVNRWTKNYYGHFEHPVKLDLVRPKWHRLKRFLEWILNNRMGNALDLLFMKITMKRWQQKFSDFDPQKLELTMRSKRDVSKHHPSDFQTRVLEKVDAKYTATVERFKANK